MDTSLFVKRLESSGTTDVTEDFTLPDYQPEIQRVVGVSASAVTDGKYLTGDELEADGGVTYTVLYVAADGSLAQTSQTSSYTASIPVKCEDDRFSVGEMVLGCTADGVSCRVTGPRRFTLSSRVRHSLMSQKTADGGLKAEGCEAGAVRSRTQSYRTAAVTEYRRSCEVSGELRERAGMRVIMARGCVGISDVQLEGQGRAARIKGDAYVTVLLLSPEGEYVTARGRESIEETVELEDTARAVSACGVAFCGVTLIEIESGDGGDLAWRMEYDIDCDVMSCRECSLVTDAYLTGTDSQLTVGELTATVPACAVNGRLTAQTTARARAGMKYICGWGSGSAEKCEASGDRMTVYGTVKVNVIYLWEGEVMSDEVSLPFRYECEGIKGVGELGDGELTRRIQITVTDVGVRADGDKMSVTAELAISVIAVGVVPLSAVVAIAPVGESCNDEENIIRVYVPDVDETAWDVEKRFRLGREACCEGGVYII